jgi:diamine N-acetyltransferase
MWAVDPRPSPPTTSAPVTLREITKDNRASIKALRVSPKQEDYVASVKASLATAARTPGARPWYRAVYAGELPVGFLMICDDVPPGDPDMPWRYYLWRMLIDRHHQGRGYGRAALDRLVGYLATRPGADLLVASVVPGRRTPLGFYLRYGFEPTGRIFDGEQVIQLRLATAPTDE